MKNYLDELEERLRKLTEEGAHQRVRGASNVGFTDPTHGVAIGFTGSNWRLYYTIDGGVSYHLVPIG
jgi:hypothetical protein